MAIESPCPLSITAVCGAASLATKQYHFVKLHTDGTAIVCDAATDQPIGVLQNNPPIGGSAEIVVIGLTKVSADAALSINDLIGTSVDGQADPKVWGTDKTEYIVGRVVVAAGAGGVIGSALVDCTIPVKANLTA
jgi:hypothetical protein